MSYRSTPTIRVRYNRRTTLRPLNQMNGDHLGQLRAPRFGEWSKNVCGHNASSTALLKRDVRVWFEEHANSVERIRRKQEKSYKELLRLFREKKRVLRAAYRHQAEECKEAWYRADKRQRETYRDASSLFGTDSSFRLHATEGAAASTGEGATGGAKRDRKTVVSIDEDIGIVAKDAHGHDAGSLQAILAESTVDIHSPAVVRLIGEGRPVVKVRAVAVALVPLLNAGQTSTPRENTVKCVEVRKHRPNDPLTIERTSSNIKKECTEKEPRDTIDTSDRVNVTHNVSVESALTIPGRGSRATAIKRAPPVHQGAVITQAVSRTAQKRTPRRSRSPNSSTTSRRTTLQPSRSVSKLPPIRQRNSKTTVSDDTTTACLSTQREIVTNKNVVSLAKLIRLRRQEREAEKKRILDNECVPIYTKTSSGDVEATVLSFHRKEFIPPSQRESYFRYKMLRAQEEARRVQGDRVKTFLEKIRGDELTFEEQQQQQMDAKGDGTTPKPKVAAASNGLGGGLAKVAAAFNAYANARYNNDVTTDE